MRNVAHRDMETFLDLTHQRTAYLHAASAVWFLSGYVFFVSFEVMELIHVWERSFYLLSTIMFFNRYVCRSSRNKMQDKENVLL